MSLEKRSEAIDLSHHLSHLAQVRLQTPLEVLQGIADKPGIISLAGGLPHPDYFPFSSIVGNVFVADSFPDSVTRSSFSWLWRIFSGSNKEKSKPLLIPKYPAKPKDISLSTSLQYGMISGIPQLRDFTKDFTDKIYQPAYSNYETLVHTGNTDGWHKVVLTLCNPGEGVLAAEWTYPSAMSMMTPHGIKAIPLLMDGQGIRSDTLRSLLSEWDEEVRGMPRPHVMYTIPIGQNPTGVTTGTTRKKEIYQICVEFDIIIVEDDPYYFLQQGHYVDPSERPSYATFESDEDYISNLAPSYLKYDYQGRVIRLDTFSKTIAPGCRLGWFTCNPVFAEKLEIQGEVSTQAPCGFGQSIIAALMLDWGSEGYIRWLKALRVQYRRRRDFFIDCLHEEFRLESSPNGQGIWEGCEVYLAFNKSISLASGVAEKYHNKGAMFSLAPPTAGMFIWIKMHFENHPSFKALGNDTLEMKLWDALASAGVLLGPGSMFAADSSSVDNTPTAGHFRISFSNVEPEALKKALSIFASVVKDFFGKL